MLLIIVIAVVLIVLFKMGVFRSAGKCQCCGAALKGTEQKVYGSGKTQFILCKSCSGKVHPQIRKYAMKNWSYTDYTDYLEWDEATKEERSEFNPDYKYGFGTKLFVDTERGLFSLGYGGEDDLVLRIADLKDYDLNFKPAEMKEGLLGTKVKGDEYAAFEMAIPNVYLEEAVRSGVSLSAKKKGIFSSNYEYSLSEKFVEIIRAFTICIYLEALKQEEASQYEAGNTAGNIDEIEKALALFMFDSMADVTADNLKKQRNALIKAFHPDNSESNEAYSQKINAAYELLSRMISRENVA